MKIIYVDDEKPALDNFRLTVASFPEIDSLELFQEGEKALAWAENHIIDAAFLDMEMSGLHGLELSRRLQEIVPGVRIIFVTAYSQYALDAWNINATGYVLKPYTASDIRKELAKCIYHPLPSQRIQIQTIPTFSLSIDGVPLSIPGEKLRELMALFVERGEQGLTTNEGIAYLWPERSHDNNTQSLFRMTYKRLTNVLEDAGIGHVLVSKGNRKILRADLVDCDLYRILSGDKNAGKKYAGQYLQEYAWAEDRNGQLYRMLLSQVQF